MDSPTPKKPEMSISEKTQLAASAAEWRHYKRQFQPIEEQQLSDSARDFSDRAEAQGNSSVFRAGTGSLQAAAFTGGVSRSAGAVGGALTSSGVSAVGAERSERDERMVGTIGIGRKIATDTQSSLSGLARSGANTAIAEMQNKLKVDTARSSARAKSLGSLAGAGAAVYADSLDQDPSDVEVVDLSTTLTDFSGLLRE